MAINVNALKAKLDKFNRTNSSNRSEAIWRPTEGKHTVRIVPYKGDRENPFIEQYFHYLGNKTLLSPITYGRRDPIAEFADELRQSGKEGYQQARPFMPKLRTYVPIIVRGEEDKGVRLFSFGKTVYKQLLEFFADPDVGDLSDPVNGRDIVVTYVPQEKSDTNFAKTTVMFKPNQTKLSNDPSLVEKFLNEQPNIADLYEEKSYAELKSILAQHLDPEGTIAMEEDSSPEKSPSKTVSKAAPAATRTSIKDKLDEFDQLFDS
jgi:hypothetical protein